MLQTISNSTIIMPKDKEEKIAKWSKIMLKQLVKRCVPKVLLDKYYYPYRWLYRNCRTLAKEYNQLQSMKEWKCIGKNGEPLPWYTYPCIEYLDNLDFSKKCILEFGGGGFISLLVQESFSYHDNRE